MGDDDLNSRPLPLGALVVLREPFSDLTYPSPYDRVVCCIVVGFSAKHLDPDGAFFERAITIMAN
jgi:hypothetical protein